MSEEIPRLDFPECPWCDTPLPDDAGAYYHRKDCERQDLQRRLAKCADPDERWRLKRELEQVSYTGD